MSATEVDQYLNTLPSMQRKALEGMRRVIKQQLPEAQEMISYGVPTYKYQGRPLIYIAAFAHHLSIYPASDEMAAAIPELKVNRAGKGTLRFPVDQPPSKDLLKKILQFRLESIGG